MRTRRAVLLSAVAMTLVACTSGGPVSTGPAVATQAPPAGLTDSPLPPVSDLPDACDLLNAADVEAVVGGAVEASSPDGVTCFWLPVEEDGLAVTVSLVPLDAQSCIDVHTALGESAVFDYEGAAGSGVPGFWQYRETLSGTHVGGYELCTDQVNVGLRVESAAGAPADELGQRAMADQLAPLALESLREALGS